MGYKFILPLFVLTLTLGVNGLGAHYAHAQSHAKKSVEFIFPMDCVLGETCWNAAYPDVAPDEKARDFTCSRKTYNDHKGTDFILKDMKAMAEGVNVLAAADGEVIRFRDSMEDSEKTPDQLDQLKEEKTECGNGVLIGHANGLFTMYCHLKKDSILVTQGQDVKAGDVLGQVGSSGYSQIPHLHFGVMKDDNLVDPYTGMRAQEGCGKYKKSFWKPELGMKYEPAAIFNIGFALDKPDFPAIKAGEWDYLPDTLPADTQSLVIWAGFAGLMDGDALELTIKTPKGQEFVSRTHIQEGDSARQFYYSGRIGKKPLPDGIYIGTVSLTRDDKLIKTKTTRVTIEKSGDTVPAQKPAPTPEPEKETDAEPAPQS